MFVPYFHSILVSNQPEKVTPPVELKPFVHLMLIRFIREERVQMHIQIYIGQILP